MQAKLNSPKIFTSESPFPDFIYNTQKSRNLKSIEKLIDLKQNKNMNLNRKYEQKHMNSSIIKNKQAKQNSPKIITSESQKFETLHQLKKNRLTFILFFVA